MSYLFYTFRACYISILVFLCCSNIAFGVSTISVSKGNFAPVPIAINDFMISSSGITEITTKIHEVIKKDLESSGIFNIVNRRAFIENKIGLSHTPLFGAWKQINATLLLNGVVTKKSRNRIKIVFALWDVVIGKAVFAEFLESDISLWRRVAHKISDKIYEKVTGDAGYFDTRITYIAETGPAKKRIKRLAIMDYDGENHEFLTDGKTLVLTPRFSPKADKILYISYFNKIPKVHMLNLKTKKDVIVGHFEGMSFAPRFSPDGTRSVLSIAKNGATNLVEINLSNMKMKPLTKGSAINTSPSYSPDGKKIVFNSDRSGTRQLYVMNADGSNVQRISFGSGVYASPSWSPRGDYITCTKIQNGEFVIAILRSDGFEERIITKGYLTENPCWAPNGRMIAFTREYKVQRGQNPNSKIRAIDMTGYNEYEILTPINASDVEWSKQLD